MSRRGVVVSRETEDGKVEKELYSPESMKHNALSLTSGRTITAVIGGLVSGILGITGVPGAISYFVYMLMFSGCLMLKLKFNYQQYFGSWKQLFVDGMFGSVTTYILFWTLSYNAVHVF
mmetsp:Transcript_9330/g.23951  ORF Transcript_9330/g.23951 Transcript_9330/m.23951 type:complete len:119 (+) Transcript_9330:109-465(+)